LNIGKDTPQKQTSSYYGWYIISLGALTHIFVIAMPMTCIAVLFPEIGRDLSLDLVQISVVWGLLPVGGILVTLLGGLLGDRFGVKRVLIVGCVLVGLAGALRGTSGSFAALATTSFLFGVLVAVIPLNVHKLANIWVPKERAGLANGMLSMGMAVGFTVSTAISARWLSPELGGWRNVLYLLGGISLVFAILWSLTRNVGQHSVVPEQSVGKVPFKEALLKVLRMKRIWLLGLVLLGQAGSVRSMLGYVPTYLETQRGWADATGGGPLVVFHLTSAVFTVPIAFLSDRIGSRRKVLLPALALTAMGVGFLAIPNNTSIWVLMLIAGITRDGFMAVFITMATETKGIGSAYAATALGALFTMERLGLFILPYIGGILAKNVNTELPFIVWGALAAVSFIVLYFLKESRTKSQPVVYPRRKQY
jgi:NNP family nitrate/nitrite transporter-like MFS transporter